MLISNYKRVSIQKREVDINRVNHIGILYVRRPFNPPRLVKR